MPSYVFDIETDGFLEEMTVVNSLVLKDIDTGEVISCADQDGYTPVKEGIKLLEEADQIIGHNIIKFDCPALHKLFPGIIIGDNPFGNRPPLDTLVCTRLMWSDIKDSDFGRAKAKKLPTKLIGSHSLEAWGYRLGNYKGDFKGPWDTWTKEMQDYCEQDVEVTYNLYKRILEKEYSQDAIDLEHQFCHVIARQERFGFEFDMKAASDFYGKLVEKRNELQTKLQEVFPPWEVRTPFVPKVNNAKLGYEKGVKTYKVKVIEFNPNSRQHIAHCLTERYGWKPTVFTEGGQAKVDESVLKDLDYPEAKIMAEYFLVNKRIAQLAEGKQGWMKCEKKGRIYGSVNTNGAVTGRCTHSHPNIAQVPSVSAEFGKECRALFTVRRGHRLVGCDASGLELRCLAHYMARWDSGAYAKEVTEGDIHTANQIAAGLPTRNQAKTFIYAFLYGAGGEKIGSIVEGSAKEGNRLKGRFLRKTPALKYLIDAVQRRATERGHLIGLDGRHLKIRSPHAALNTLLQSAGALVMKQALIVLDQRLQKDEGLKPGDDYEFVANIHDEFQIEVKEDLAETVGQLAVQSIRDAGDHFDFQCPLDGEYKIGKTWAETH
jgi:DNA polymerase I-like protein with 3'-5' exonuclease and polymerase domains